MNKTKRIATVCKILLVCAWLTTVICCGYYYSEYVN